MFERKTSDLHMHLNGSFSLNFLAKTAEKNKATESFLELLKVRQQYADLLASKVTPEITAKSIGLIWKQFGLIHKIVQSLDDIYEGTIDVIDASKARYLEIRTTPKGIGSSSWQAYVAAFVKGLEEGNRKFSSKKIARGILSLDRTLHTPEDAYKIIDQVVLEKQRSGLLVGIDISGNPDAERKLSGEGLVKVLAYALDKDLGIAIHIGETAVAAEKQDVDLILATLTAWQKQLKTQEANPFHGKLRLGHGIFLTDEQREQIKQLQLPIEICPSCHEKLNWWKVDQPHPVTGIYKFWKDPVVTGTDDEMIFGGNAKEENHRVLSMLGYPDQKRAEARAHQAKFRFAHSSAAKSESSSQTTAKVEEQKKASFQLS